MASGNQSVKTPTGWNATQGAWVKTGSSTWSAVDQIYIKTPSGWNNASGQELTQVPYPYIANSQTPYIANGQQPYIADARQPSEYQHRSPFTYRNPVNAQEPNIRNRQTPFTYQNPVNGQQPNIRNAQNPFTYDARYPANAQSPSNKQSPFTYDARYPANIQQPVAFRSPFTYRVPYIANARQPVAYRSPFTYRVPYIANARQPLSARNPFTYNARSAVSYYYPDPFPSGGGGGGGGCFVAGTPILMHDGTTKPIESIVLGDQIKTWGEEGQGIVEVEKLMSPRPTKVVNLVIANENGDTVAELGTTKDHPFKLADGTWGVVDTEYWKENHSNLENTEQLYGEELNEVNLKVGDKIQSVWGSAVLKDIIDTGEEKEVYHILKVGNFYTDGVVAHNFMEEPKTVGEK